MEAGLLRLVDGDHPAFPTVGDLRRAMLGAVSPPGVPADASGAFDLARDVVRWPGYYRQAESYARLDPTTRAAVHRYGWEAWCLLETSALGTARAQFRQFWEECSREATAGRLRAPEIPVLAPVDGMPALPPPAMSEEEMTRLLEREAAEARARAERAERVREKRRRIWEADPVLRKRLDLLDRLPAPEVDSIPAPALDGPGGMGRLRVALPAPREEARS